MNFKKIISFAAIALLLLLYIATFISAIFTTPVTPELFKVCVLATFVIPVFLYAYLLIYKLMKDRAEAAKEEINEAIRAGASSEAEADTSENITDVDPTVDTTANDSAENTTL